MQMRRSLIVTLVGGLLLALMVTTAFAQDRQEIDAFGSGEVADFEGDLEVFCPDYPVGDCLLILVELVGPACTNDTPLVSYDVKLGPGVEADSVDITFVNPEGDDAEFPDQPLSGELLWPGASFDDGDVDWPGWILTDAGWFLDDPDALEFPSSGVEVTFDAGPTATVAGPQLEEDECAPEAEVGGVALTRDPPPETAVLGATLARTGTSTLLLVILGSLLAITGGVLVRSRRRAADGA